MVVVNVRLSSSPTTTTLADRQANQPPMHICGVGAVPSSRHEPESPEATVSATQWHRTKRFSFSFAGKEAVGDKCPVCTSTWPSDQTVDRRGGYSLRSLVTTPLPMAHRLQRMADGDGRERIRLRVGVGAADRVLMDLPGQSQGPPPSYGSRTNSAEDGIGLLIVGAA
jgi:hypothetical protein